MIKGTIYGHEVEMQGSPYTFLVFQEEFGVGLTEHLQKAYSPEGTVEDLLRVAWAMARTHSDSVPPYIGWLKGFEDGFTLHADPSEVIDSAIIAELFRDPTPKGIRRRLARFLVTLAQRLGA